MFAQRIINSLRLSATCIQGAPVFAPRQTSYTRAISETESHHCLDGEDPNTTCQAFAEGPLTVPEAKASGAIAMTTQPHSWTDVLSPPALWEGRWQYQIVTILTVIAVSCIATRLVTTFRFNKTLSGKADARRTPTLPYSIPIVGHAFSMGLDIVGFNRYIAFVTS